MQCSGSITVRPDFHYRQSIGTDKQNKVQTDFKFDLETHPKCVDVLFRFYFKAAFGVNFRFS